MPHRIPCHLVHCVLLAFASLLLATACATTKPGTGDISFRLRWDGSADLDLHVLDPVGRHIGTEMRLEPMAADEARRQAEEQRRIEEANAAIPKGFLDIDCNADPERMCKRPIENIFWPTDTAPHGTYTVWAHHFQNVTGEGLVPFTLEIRRGERVVRTVRGAVDRDARTSEKTVVQF